MDAPHQLYQNCLEALRNIPGILVNEPVFHGINSTAALSFDVEISIKERPENVLRLDFRVKSHGRYLPYRGIHPVVHCYWHVNRKQAHDFKLQDHLFIDTAGNMFIHGQGIYLWSSGNSPKSKTGRAGNAFHAAGLKLIWAILNSPPLLNGTVREIATEANIAHGKIGEQLKGLEELGFVRTLSRDSRILTQASQLLERWVQGYVERLRPKLLIGKYRFAGEFSALLDRVAHIHGVPASLFLGGELAASLRYPHLIVPGTATIHQQLDDESLSWILGELRLAPTQKNPNVFLVKPLGRAVEHENKTGIWLADPIQTLGELSIHHSQRLDEIKSAIVTDILRRLENSHA